MTPVEVAQHIFSSDELLFNPFKLCSPEHRECADELLRLTEEALKDE